MQKSWDLQSIRYFWRLMFVFVRESLLRKSKYAIWFWKINLADDDDDNCVHEDRLNMF